MNITLFLAHSIEEYDQVRLLSSLGHTVFSPGSYIHPDRPLDNLRPALDVPDVPELAAAVDLLGQPNHPPHGKCNGAEPHKDSLWAAKQDTPQEIIDWTDVLIVHHLEHTWYIPQADRWKGTRVIWRTVGQSSHHNEWLMAPFKREGWVEIVRYSPKERNLPNFAGEDALIRFYKDPAEWTGWNGNNAIVANASQGLYRRSLADDGRLQPPGAQWTSYGFWRAATKDLPATPAGPNSEQIGGLGKLDVPALQAYLRDSRCYLFTGTQPASYTLGLIEAMMTGIPVVSIGPQWYRIMPYGPQLFEGHEIAALGTNDPDEAYRWLVRMIEDHDFAREISAATRARALEMFAMDKIANEWREYLGQ